jgi:putative colanic acid biosynthesis UDP-glucose lipid carrier transferase
MTDASACTEFDVLSRQQFSGLSKPKNCNTLKFETCVTVFAIVEAASVIVSAVVAKFLYLYLAIGQIQPSWPYLAPAPLLAVSLYLFLKQSGLYDPASLNQRTVAFGRIFGALATSFLVVLGILYVLKFADWYSRGWFLLWFALSAICLLTTRVVGLRLVRQAVAAGKLHERIAIFGTSEFVTALKLQIEAADQSGAVEGLYLGTPLDEAREAAAFDGGINELRAAISLKQYDTVIIAFPADQTALIKAAVSELAPYSSELLLCTRLNHEPHIIRGARNFGSLHTDVVNLVPLAESNHVLKRTIDYALAGLGLILLAPLLALIAIAIKIDSPGPVFFRQRRYGQNNRIFRIFKFRTMSVTEDGTHVKQAERNDSRVTRIGWFLRRSSLDELPQLINVMLGDMSIVGPRPHALVHDELFEQQLDLFSLRRRVRPGLTGWAQVNGLRGETKTTSDIRKRVEHDLYYIDNWSVWLDMEIMIRTLFVLFRGAY